MKTQDISLNGQWRFRQSGKAPIRVKRWLPATVPGTVHTDLLANGLIDDPFYRTNEDEVRWVEYADWEYRTGFRVPAALLEKAGAVWLDFEGLDTFATIRLNGRRVGTTDNMFHPWRFEVSRLLHSGRNVLDVVFTSAPRKAEAIARASKTEYKSMFFLPRVHIRKAQYSGGWDWGPRLMTCGVWRNVRLRVVSAAAVVDVHAVTRELNDDAAVLEVRAEIESFTTGTGTLGLELRCRSTGGITRHEVRTRLRPGRRTVKARIRVEQPRRWWPAGMGAQELYDLHTRLRVGEEEADQHELTIGLRTAELVREPDEQGESFRFRINGQDVFCKGANWIPADSFLPRVTPERYRGLLTDAVEANMNMIRVWGGGVYEDPAFYRTCDELGLMVWQDFLFACAEYPEDATFMAGVRREAEHAVRRLRNHASLVLWNGNNENEWLTQEIQVWGPRPRFYGRRIYHELLPSVCRRLDPTRPYWPGSPFGGPTPNSPDHGNQHVWTVFGWWAEPQAYRKWPARFVSEFGFQALPSLKTIRSFTEPADRSLLSPVMEHHNKMSEQYARIIRYLTPTFGLPRDLDEAVYLSNVLQGDVIRIGVEHWRRRWPMSAGALYWQLNDCWPVTSWSAIDCRGDRKGLWYASRRFFSPILVSLCPTAKDPFGPTDLEVWVTHDRPSRVPVVLEVAAWSLDGERRYRERSELRLPANGSRRVSTLRYDDLRLSEPDREVVQVRLKQGRRVLSSSTHWFAPAKHVRWPNPRFHTSIERAGEGYRIDVTAEQAARAVLLDVDRWEGRFDDNYFDLMPGESHSVSWVPKARLPQAGAFRRALRTRSLADVS